jgi:hypothetical protein
MTAVAEAVYVFGIVPDDVAESVERGDGIDIVSNGSVAAVVGSVPADRPLGADDLRRHDRVIASFVDSGIPVLPMRFGAAVADRAAVVSDLLEPNADAYTAALDKLTGVVQFTVQVRYERTGLLREILADDPNVLSARAVAGDPAASTAAKMRLGELVVAAIGRRRPADAEHIRFTLAPRVRALRVTLADDPDSVAQLACLVRSDRTDKFIDTLERLARDLADTMRLRLLGPLAPYDFVPNT